MESFYRGEKMAKRYYWLKLKEDFFNDPRIKKLRRIAGGDTYTIIYLKLMLLSLQNDGVLSYEGIEESFTEEIALTIDEDPQNVSVTWAFLKAQKLIEEITDTSILLSKVPEMIGSETDKAEIMRRARANAVRSGNNVTKALPTVTFCYTDKDKDKDKELYKDRDIDNNSDSQSSISTKNIVNLYHSICVSLPKVTAPLSYNTRRDIAERLKNEGYNAIKAVFEKAEESDFLTGKIQKGWTADLNWLMIFKNFCKVLEDKYRNREKRGDENAVDTETSTSTYKGYELTGITIL